MSVYHIPLLGNKVQWTIHSLAALNDRGDLHNPFNLSAAQLASRQLLRTSLTDSPTLDHLRSSHLSANTSPASDPLLYHSATATRLTPLTAQYAMDCASPFICLYTLIDVRVSVWGVQTIASEYIARELTAVWCRLLRLLWCWQDEWRDSSWQQEVDREKGEVKGAGSEAEAEKRVAADGWQRYLSELQRGIAAGSSGGRGTGGQSGGDLHGGSLTDGCSGDKKWARRAVTDVVNKWKLRSRL